ncbi:alpha/beta hydrolase [Bacillus cytotoxicus]|uniref:Alpha/beta hydrolase n=1 Tax=Bacillus cytotoxicus TaxID=580165 RepID=A0ACC6ABB9_9BACI|nr:alpha/beta hydrolase [Bacillus cytotoxicus]
MEIQFSKRYSAAEIFHTESKEYCVVFVHGFSESKTCWDDIVRHIQKHSNVVTYDCLGHGNNSDLWEETSFNAYVTQLKELITFLKQEEKFNKIILVGHSQGAAIATQYTLQHFDNIDKLILISPFTYIAEPLKATWTNFLELVKRGDEELFWDINSSLLLGPKSEKWSHLRGDSIQHRLDFFSKKQLVFLIKALLNVNVVGDISTLHNKLACLIHGEYDTMFPNYYSKEILKSVPQAKYIQVSNANHLLVELEPYVSQTIIQVISEIA